jgi:hypothetical protein
MKKKMIKRKKCKCGCEKYPTLGYKGYYVKHFPEELETKKSNKIITEKSKSESLKVADILFGAFIKRRDSDSKGNVTCVCCGLTYNLKDKRDEKDYVVQALHFVSRGTYSQRFNENNVHAGCSTCNLKMHLEPTGFAYQKYRSFLIDALGLDEVQRMEEEKNKIGKITKSDIEFIINKYKTTKNDK